MNTSIRWAVSEKSRRCHFEVWATARPSVGHMLVSCWPHVGPLWTCSQMLPNLTIKESNLSDTSNVPNSIKILVKNHTRYYECWPTFIQVWQIFVRICRKYCKIPAKTQFGAVQKWVNPGDLTTAKLIFYLKKSASVQPRASPPRFVKCTKMLLEMLFDVRLNCSPVKLTQSFLKLCETLLHVERFQNTRSYTETIQYLVNAQMRLC